MASFLPIAATGLLGLLNPFFGPPKPPAPPPPVPPTVAEPISASPPGKTRGTMLLLHGGGWTGPDREAQRQLMRQPGEMLSARGWRVVSVDYAAGRAGLQDVLDAAGQELRRPSGALLCIYGESSGGHLALIAAARLRAVDCVVAAGAPMSFALYRAEARASGDRNRGMVADAIGETFGTDPAQTVEWEPAAVAPRIAADVLLLHESDDTLVPVAQSDAFMAARPTTQRAELPSGDQADPAAWWLHGTLSEEGRARYASALGAFADRAAAAHRDERRARRLRCSGVTRSVAQVGERRVRRALRCLARRDARARRAGPARGTYRKRARGEVNAARAWALLRRSRSGRSALAGLARGRARALVRSGNPSRITVRPRRR